MRKKVTLLSLLFILISAIELSDYFYIPKNWPKPLYDFSQNPLSKEKIELGRLLFYDPILSKDNTISCASCHTPFSAFTHIDHALSHGIEDRIGTRNSPALMNLAWQKQFMWDGAINHLDMQPLAPISHPDEMGSSIDVVVQRLFNEKFYRQYFYNAFGDSVVTGENTLKALSQFMLTLISANSKYDKVNRNEETFTLQEWNGYQLFKKNCNTCHQEPLFTNGNFADNGLSLDKTLNDFGRFKITQNTKDSFCFKIPTLRNIEYSYPYMHDGRFNNISQVLNHYSKGIKDRKSLDVTLQKPIELSSNEKVDLLSFLLTLSEKEFVFNPKFQFPKKLILYKAKE